MTIAVDLGRKAIRQTNNLIWRTVSRLVDEVISSDRVEGGPMVWPHPQDVILYARSSYFYDNMFIICLFLTFFMILKLVWSVIPKNCGNICHNVTFLDATSTCFPPLIPCLQLRIEMQIFSLHWMMQNIRLFNVCEARRASRRH